MAYEPSVAAQGYSIIGDTSFGYDPLPLLYILVNGKGKKVRSTGHELSIDLFPRELFI